MNRTIAVCILALGGVLLLTALVIGSLTVTTEGVKCGSALKPDTRAQDVADLRAALQADAGLNPGYDPNALPSIGCDDALRSTRVPAIGLGVIGLGVLAGGVVAWAVAGNAETAPRARHERQAARGGSVPR